MRRIINSKERSEIIFLIRKSKVVEQDVILVNLLKLFTDHGI